MQLDGAAARAGVRLLTLGETPSTNTRALEEARRGERGPLWVVARTQTAGRGRRGRVWTSKPGNVYASLLLTDPAPGAQVAQLSFVAALAVHDAIAEAAPMLGPGLSLKWPNDVLCGGAKFSGILLEGEGGAVVLGIGINCLHHPEGTDYPATDLNAAGAHVVADDVFMALSRAMVVRIAQWQRGEGFAAIRSDWLKRADGLGRGIRVRLHDRETTGIFETLDETGRLVLRHPDGLPELIAAGDVFPRHAAGVEPA
jgi:BirA family biotin operon repressor/biotin-[acetyl-CoA-carboxylase] ligase